MKIARVVQRSVAIVTVMAAATGTAVDASSADAHSAGSTASSSMTAGVDPVVPQAVASLSKVGACVFAKPDEYMYD